MCLRHSKNEKMKRILFSASFGRRKKVPKIFVIGKGPLNSKKTPVLGKWGSRGPLTIKTTGNSKPFCSVSRDQPLADGMDRMALLMSMDMNGEGVHRRLECTKLEFIPLLHPSHDIHVITEF